MTADGRGVEGVAVTDGRTIVRTDAKGRYRLASASDAEFVYLTLPDGYEIPAEAARPHFTGASPDRSGGTTSRCGEPDAT